MKKLFLDIETSPAKAYVWGAWDQNISKEMLISDWTILSWAAKWQGKKRIHQADVETMSEEKMLKGMWNLMNSAEIIVTQNGKKFDEKKLKARFIYYGFPPPSSYLHYDTLKIAKKHFGFTYNNLAYLAKFLKTKHQKLEHKKYPGFELWEKCLAGVKDAWKTMRQYNRADVIVLEEVYDKLIIYEPLARTPDKCTCGSTNYQKNGHDISAAGKRYQRYRCGGCGAEAKAKKAIKK